MNLKGILEPLKKAGSQIGVTWKELIKLDLNPFGASLVILTPFYNTAIGKSSVGYEVSHNLKSLFNLVGSFPYSLKSSQIFSRVPSHLDARWQF